MNNHVTETNPNGEVRQCDMRHIHESHEYQAEFGSYFDVYCPGNDGNKNEDDELELPRYVPLERVDTLVRCNRCGAVVEGDVAGQAIHDIWHDNEAQRIGRQFGVNLMGET